MTDINAKSIAGTLMILLPVVFWITIYLRFDCSGGHCSLGMEWLLVGFAMIIMGTVILLGSAQRIFVSVPEPPEEEVKKVADKKNKM